MSDAKCALVFDRRPAVFRTAPGAPAKRFYADTPFVRLAKLLGRSCITTLDVRAAPR